MSEQGVDTGGLSREFWRLFLNEVVKMYCIGDTGKCLFVKNVSALQVGKCALLYVFFLKILFPYINK